MTELTLDVARTITDAALAKCREMKLKPMAIAVLDARGCLKTFVAEDGTSLLRAEVAHGKAYGALALGRARERSQRPTTALFRHAIYTWRAARSAGFPRVLKGQGWDVARRHRFTATPRQRRGAALAGSPPPAHRQPVTRSLDDVPARLGGVVALTGLDLTRIRSAPPPCGSSPNGAQRHQDRRRPISPTARAGRAAPRSGLPEPASQQARDDPDLRTRGLEVFRRSPPRPSHRRELRPT